MTKNIFKLRYRPSGLHSGTVGASIIKVVLRTVSLCRGPRGLLASSRPNRRGLIFKRNATMTASSLSWLWAHMPCTGILGECQIGACASASHVSGYNASPWMFSNTGTGI
jgi:hypothetical protein